MTQITCAGNVVTDTNGVAMCQDAGGAALPWTSQPAFSIESLDPAIAGGAFAAGFVLVGASWAIGRGAKIVLSMLR